MSYVIEFIEDERPTYYAGYSNVGPLFALRREEAFKFDLLYKAQRVLDGDPRLLGGRAIELSAADSSVGP
jgi:hypothetical protein